MKLQHKTFLMLSILMAVIVGLISIVYIYQSNASLENQLKGASLDMAITVSVMPDLIEALSEGKQDDSIQKLLLPLMKTTRYQYIIVMDMKGIQYSYPYESGLYKPYKNGGQAKVLTEGLSYVSLDNNELISAVRAFAPIYDGHRQIGAVLVGLLTTSAKSENQNYVSIMEGTLVFGIILGLGAAIIFSLNIKKSTFGLEPKDIALLVTEKDLIFQNIERGIIAVNHEGYITLCNKRASSFLNIKQATGKHIQEISPYLNKIFTNTRIKGSSHHHQVCSLEKNVKVLIHLCPIKDADGKITGQVLSMEDMTEARVLAEELTDYRSLIESLRAQNHEFMNKLQTISGLIQLENYDMALDFIEGQANKNHQFNRLLTAQIHDNNIAALLLVKYEQASEKKIKFYIDEDSTVRGLPKSISSEDFCLVIGNIINNSMDVLEKALDPFISIFISADENHLEMEISNNGPPLIDTPENIFKKGYSSKGSDHGYGLYLTHSTISNAGGEIYWKNEEEVTWYVKI